MQSRFHRHRGTRRRECAIIALPRLVRGSLILLIIRLVAVEQRLFARSWQMRQRRRHLTAAAADRRQNRIERLAQAGGRDRVALNAAAAAAAATATRMIELRFVLVAVD